MIWQTGWGGPMLLDRSVPLSISPIREALLPLLLKVLHSDPTSITLEKRKYNETVSDIQ